jgi:protein-disulfide isomerase
MSFLRRSVGSLLLGTLALVGAPAGLASCSKNATDVPSSANAAAAKPAPGAAQQGGGADDTSPPPGVDLTKLDDFERKVFFRVVNKEASACGKGHSLMHSLKNDRSCRKSLGAARYVTRLVDAGYTDSEIGEKLQKRYRAGSPKTIDVTDAPVKGNANAQVTLIEFVDFECPHCRRVQPVLRQLLEEYPEVKLYFKHYPLGGHTNARLAAEAATAAHRQGKFWAFTDKVWANADAITPAALEKWAKESGLDVTKWRADLESQAIKDRVQKDKADGAAVGIQSTPTIFINGKLYADSPDIDGLRDWVNEELGR